jgi:hypothetical protein
MNSESLMHKIQLVVFLSLLNTFATMVMAAQTHSPDGAAVHGRAVTAESVAQIYQLNPY